MDSPKHSFSIYKQIAFICVITLTAGPWSSAHALRRHPGGPYSGNHFYSESPLEGSLLPELKDRTFFRTACDLEFHTQLSSAVNRRKKQFIHGKGPPAKEDKTKNKSPSLNPFYFPFDSPSSQTLIHGKGPPAVKQKISDEIRNEPKTLIHGKGPPARTQSAAIEKTTASLSIEEIIHLHLCGPGGCPQAPTFTSKELPGEYGQNHSGMKVITAYLPNPNNTLSDNRVEFRFQISSDGQGYDLKKVYTILDEQRILCSQYSE